MVVPKPLSFLVNSTQKSVSPKRMVDLVKLPPPPPSLPPPLPFPPPKAPLSTRSRKVVVVTSKTPPRWHVFRTPVKPRFLSFPDLTRFYGTFYAPRIPDPRVLRYIRVPGLPGWPDFGCIMEANCRGYLLTNRLIFALLAGLLACLADLILASFWKPIVEGICLRTTSFLLFWLASRLAWLT